MYFISSGSLTVELEPEAVQLGSGDFFGELALVTHQPRTADVRAAGFCELLMLSTTDFQTLLEANPETMQIVEEVAHERLGQDAVRLSKAEHDDVDDGAAGDGDTASEEDNAVDRETKR